VPVQDHWVAVQGVRGAAHRQGVRAVSAVTALAALPESFGDGPGDDAAILALSVPRAFL
jgi:hypothetical protein